MKRLHHALSLSVVVACIATAGVALPVSAPIASTGRLDALLTDIAAAGVISGASGIPTGTRGFSLEVGENARDLGITAARASNSAGTIIGDGAVEAGTHAMIWMDGHEPRDLGDLAGGDVASVAYAINEAGDVVGRGRTAEGDRAFVWTEANGMRDLNDMVAAEPGTILNEASAIDDDGRIAGRATVDGVERAFVWTPKTSRLVLAEADRGARQRIVDLTSIQAAGPAVGRALSKDGRDRPVAWYPGSAAIDLGDLPGGAERGVAYNVDSLGWIVGSSATDDGDRAFVWQEDSGMMDLNDLVSPPSDIVLTAAVSIIDDGRILAYGRDGKSLRFVRLVPVAAPSRTRAGLVPEKGIADLQAFEIIDLGEFVGITDSIPILAMDETGRVVGACDLLSTACPYLSDLASVTNFFEPGTRLSGSIFETLQPVTKLMPALLPLGNTTRPGGGTQLTPNRRPPFNPGGGGDMPFGGGGRRGDMPGAVAPSEEPNLPVIVTPLPASWIGLLAAFGLLGLMRRRGLIA